MPLNSNSKIDKLTLPFPDAAQSATATPATGKVALTKEKMHELWSKILASALYPLPLEKSSFDLSGHSILTIYLIFEHYKSIIVNVPLGIEVWRTHYL